MNGNYQGADSVLAGLKDFQRRTAKYAFTRLFTDPDPTFRFLVADEVGLGKTFVARALIAQTIDHLRDQGDPRIDIIYICSNTAIARQNVRRIDVTQEGALDSPGADRLTMLPTQLGSLGTTGINIIPITPGTSFDLGFSSGRFGERALLFSLLRYAWGEDRLGGAAPARLFYWGISDNPPSKARRRLYSHAKEYDGVVPTRFKRAFKSRLVERNRELRLKSKPILQEQFDALLPNYDRPRKLAGEIRNRRNAFIGSLRQLVAELAVAQLQPDLVILDEFQRFKRLLDVDDDRFENRIARKLFTGMSDTGKRTRVLLLSATPYKMYTQHDDADEDDHHEDLIHTLRFLFDSDERAEEVREQLRRLHHCLLDGSPGVSGVERSCRDLSVLLRRVMTRTERVSEQRDAMIRQMGDGLLGLERSDVRAFLASQHVADELGVPSPVELWKSGTYLLNFLEGYALQRKLQDQLDEGHEVEAFRSAISSGDGLLPWEDIHAYRPLDPGNARLRALVTDTVDQDMWKLLWLPPALPYYESGSEFDTDIARTATKRLVFSGWRLVPKVIAAVTSYEAERRMTQLESTSIKYTTEFNSRPGRLLDFRMDGDRPGAMTSLAFIYPSPALAALGDPRTIDAGTKPDLAKVREVVHRRIAEALEPHLRKAPTEGPIDQGWTWIAPLLLDQEAGHGDWIQNRRAIESWTGEEGREGGLAEHIDRARSVVAPSEMGRPPEDLIATVADLAMGGPGNCALRALASSTGGSTADDDIRDAAARIAWGFRALFNGPAETALVRSRSSQPYWQAALEYSIDGHLQAVLDEYLHVLREWTGKVTGTPGQVAAVIKEVAHSALTLRTTRYFADIPFINDSDRIVFERRALRGRFAVQYGDHKDSQAGDVRASHVSEAFNSPFWPFVLATTSIGQEGLDFHLYCHAVVHWNLPHNPVDLEQREGRVHRFKGHAVRKNLATVHGSEALRAESGDVWNRLFELGTREEGSDLVPYWMFDLEGGAHIERHVPMLPLTREAVRFPGLMKSVATYRLAFGQPRQEELIQHLLQHHDEETIHLLLAALNVDLTPPG